MLADLIGSTFTACLMFPGVKIWYRPLCSTSIIAVRANVVDGASRCWKSRIRGPVLTEVWVISGVSRPSEGSGAKWGFCGTNQRSDCGLSKLRKWLAVTGSCFLSGFFTGCGAAVNLRRRRLICSVWSGGPNDCFYLCFLFLLRFFYSCHVV